MTQVAGISEIVLVVADVSVAARFYREVVGLEPESDESETWAWFRVGPCDPPQRLAVTSGSLLFEEHSPRPAGQRWGPVHFALNVDRANVDTALARARTHDVVVHGPTRLEWMKAEAWYLFDPDGNLVEYWVPD